MLERERCELEIVGAGSDELFAAPARRRAWASPTEWSSADCPTATSLAQRYREADIFTLAPWEESFGDAFAEALASGLPIVGSNVGGIPELVRHGQNGLLVPPRDPSRSRPPSGISPSIRSCARGWAGRTGPTPRPSSPGTGS